MNRMEWDHPHLGRVSETVCRAHEREVLAALHTLGIGSGGSREWEERGYARCAHGRQRVRAWLDTMIVTHGPALVGEKE